MDAPSNPYAAKPWLKLYAPGIAPTQVREHRDMLSLYRAALADPAAPALIYFDGEISYGELDAMSDSLAVWLAGVGVAPGDRVTIILQNVPHFVIAMVAAWKIGAIPVPANPMYRRDELAKLFADCEPVVVVAHDDQAATAIAGLEKAGRSAQVLSVSAHDFQTRGEARVLPPRGATPAGTTDFMAAMNAYAGAAPPKRMPAPDDLGLLLYTSGTTGQPKGAMLRHSGMARSSTSPASSPMWASPSPPAPG
jgi:long-chain acyl-CoA synthetase